MVYNVEETYSGSRGQGSLGAILEADSIIIYNMLVWLLLLYIASFESKYFNVYYSIKILKILMVVLWNNFIFEYNFPARE